MSCIFREKKSGIYYIVSSNNGKRIWKSTKTRDRKKAYQLFSNNIPQKIETNQPQLLSQCIKEYISFVETTYSCKTLEIYKMALNHLAACTGDIRIDLITSRNIDLYKVFRMKDVSPTTVNIELRALRTFFNVLKRWEIIDKNPCQGIKQIRIPEQTPLFFNEEQQADLIKAMSERWLREIVIFALMTGARRGEIVNLQWSDINFEAKTITIQSSLSYQVKTGKLRTVPMNETVYNLLKDKPVKEGLVFKGKKGKRANDNFVSEKFREFVRKNGFDKRLHFHSLRHSFASVLVKKGKSLFQVQRLLGHSSSKITEVYAHLQSSDMHSVVDVLKI